MKLLLARTLYQFMNDLRLLYLEDTDRAWSIASDKCHDRAMTFVINPVMPPDIMSGRLP